MNEAAINAQVDGKTEGGDDQRTAPRFTLLIRAAKLVTAQGEFVCVIRDVSETGASVRIFHALPQDDEYELHMPDQTIYKMREVWQRDNQVGFEFVEPINVEQLISEASQYPKRGLRLGLCFPITVGTLTQRSEGVVENISQQGARFECDGIFAIEQNLRLEGEGFKQVRAKVRWRRDNQYGVVFDDTFTLGDFARFAARIQCPMLLDE